MANLVNCASCGSRERPSDLSLYAGKYLCERCAEDIFEFFSDPRSATDYIATMPIAPPRDLFGKPLAAGSEV